MRSTRREAYPLRSRAMKVAYQGIPGAFSEAAAASLFPSSEPTPRDTFADVFEALERGAVEAAVVPVENSQAGAVVDDRSRLAVLDRHDGGLDRAALERLEHVRERVARRRLARWEERRGGGLRERAGDPLVRDLHRARA